jgi:hypothetical protein
LSRVILGQLNVQGVDYAYTLNGWLKGVNSNSLNAQRDIGQDGYSGSANAATARDVFGFSLHYYSSDYKPINGWNVSASSTYFMMAESSSGGYTQSVPDLYNGNISRMVTALDKISTTTIGKAYKYDQLNRISKAYTYTNYTASTNQWNTGGANADYFTAYSYDANGNIMTLNRNAGSAKAMDSLSYHYIPGTNQLEYVDDTVASTRFDYDIDDQYADNYTYDKIGNLKSDRAEEIIDIQWTVYGKIRSITRKGSALPTNLSKKVTCINLSGATYDGSSGVLTRTAGNGWSYGATGKEILTGDGALEWTILGNLSETGNTIIGLAYANGDKDNIDYNWYTIPDLMGGTSYTKARNKTSVEESYSEIVQGDVLKIERKGNMIYWYRNGGLPVAQITETSPGAPLMVDIHMYDGGSKVEKLRLYGAADTAGGISNKASLSFEYTPDGHRVAKHVRDSAGTVTSTWYVRDASGNIMATYTRVYNRLLDTSMLSAL